MDVEDHKPSGSAPLYEEVFPALPTDFSDKIQISSELTSFQPTTITEIVEIPSEDRRNQTSHVQDSEQAQTCAHIAKVTGVRIAIANSKHRNLNVIIEGVPSKVSEAKILVLRDLQQQASRTIQIPAEYHRFLVGHNGDRRRELEAKTLTRIIIPPPNRASLGITISGPRTYLDAAEKEILGTVDFYSQQAFERLQIPKIYHPFIYGPYNQTIMDIRERTKARINIPPPLVISDIITVSGKREEVATAVKEIMSIYKPREERCTTIPAKVARDKHRLVIGPKASGLHDILEKTGVSVEPPADNSENFILRGYPEDLGRASTMVFQRASLSVREELEAPTRLHKLLIGKKGANLAALKEGFQAVLVDFQDSGKIVVQGPQEEVTIIVDRLKSKIDQLTSAFYLDSVKVDPKFHSRLLGPQGLINQYLRSNRFKIRLQSASDVGKPNDDSLLYLEGEEMSVESVKAEIEKMVCKLENEKIKDIIVDPRIQKLLRSSNSPYIREIGTNFPDVEIHWPEVADSHKNRANVSEDSPTSYIIQLCGIRDQVDAASDRLNKVIKLVKEENHEQEIRLFKDCLKRLLGSTIVRLLEETNTRIHYLTKSEDGSQPVVIIGRQENVEIAVQKLEKLQKSMANIHEISVTLPSILMSKYADSQGARLRSIKEQCEGVQISSANNQPRQLTISGPPEALDKAKSLIDAMCAKILEHGADVIVYADPKFHGQLIGRAGANLKRFRDKHDVEILFPDKLESDPKLSSQIHIIGEKEATTKAKAEFEQLVKAMEDETDASFSVSEGLIEDVWNYWKSFSYPELERVRIRWPKLSGGSDSATDRQQNNIEDAEIRNELSIRLSGAKACVEAANQCLENIVDDVKSQKVFRHPLLDPNHSRILMRQRSALLDMQRNYKTLIDFISNPLTSTDVTTENERIFGYIVLTGRPENIENVLTNELLPLLPTVENYEFPQRFHRKLFLVEQPLNRQKSQKVVRSPKKDGMNGKGKNELDSVLTTSPVDQENKCYALQLQQKYSVSIRSQGPNLLNIRGSVGNIEAVKTELSTLQSKFEEEENDWIARNYSDTLEVEERFSSRLMCERERLYASFGVAIALRSPPKPDNRKPTAPVTPSVPQESLSESPKAVNMLSDNTETPTSFIKSTNGYRLLRTSPVTIVMHGYKEKVDLVRNELETMLTTFATFCCEELHIPANVHNRLIGYTRKNIRRIEDTYNVDVEFPMRGTIGEDANIVLVMGTPNNVDLACDALINQANDFASDIPSQQQPSNGTPHNPNAEFKVSGTPWENKTVDAN